MPTPSHPPPFPSLLFFDISCCFLHLLFKIFFAKFLQRIMPEPGEMDASHEGCGQRYQWIRMAMCMQTSWYLGLNIKINTRVCVIRQTQKLCYIKPASVTSTCGQHHPLEWESCCFLLGENAPSPCIISPPLNQKWEKMSALQKKAKSATGKQLPFQGKLHFNS